MYIIIVFEIRACTNIEFGAENMKGSFTESARMPSPTTIGIEQFPIQLTSSKTRAASPSCLSANKYLHSLSASQMSVLRTFRDGMNRQNLPYQHAGRSCEWQAQGFHNYPGPQKTSSFHSNSRSDLRDSRTAKHREELKKEKIFRRVYSRCKDDKDFKAYVNKRYQRMMYKVDHPFEKVPEALVLSNKKRNFSAGDLDVGGTRKKALERDLAFAKDTYKGVKSKVALSSSKKSGAFV